MALGDRIPDKTLLKQINRKLAQGGAATKISASVNGGYVTLTGTLQYENQRRVIIRKANQVSGVRHVADQMTIQPRKRVE
jgi:osmotically-inducible protein OsmY